VAKRTSSGSRLTSVHAREDASAELHSRKGVGSSIAGAARCRWPESVSVLVASAINAPAWPADVAAAEVQGVAGAAMHHLRMRMEEC
jgi:hypothetical protein